MLAARSRSGRRGSPRSRARVSPLWRSRSAARRLVVGERPARRSRRERAASDTSARPSRRRVVVTGPARNNGFELRVPARIVRFGRLGRARAGAPRASRRPVAAPGRDPGARHAAEACRGQPSARIRRAHLAPATRRPRRRRRQGVADRRAPRRRRRLRRPRARMARAVARARPDGRAARGPRGHRARRGRGPVAGAPDAFRASGLYHLLAVSGQNVIFVAVGVLGLAWVVGLPRWLGELGALAGIGSYVLAVGAQPSVIRAGIAGALGSIAWLAARQRDRWHFLLVGALDPARLEPVHAARRRLPAVVRSRRRDLRRAPARRSALLEGYPVPRLAGEAVAVSLACGLATAPVLWLQFGRIPLYSVPANALAAPVVGPLLGLSFAAAIADAVSPASRRADRVRERLPGRLPGLVRPVRRRPAGGGGVVERGRRRAAPGRLVARRCSPSEAPTATGGGRDYACPAWRRS